MADMRAGDTGKSRFLEDLKVLLDKGRGRNILITGPANCGKTFMLNLSTKIFESFRNPMTGFFASV